MVLTVSDRLKRLLAVGYFPKELPPSFTTRTFSSQVDDIEESWAAHEGSLGQQQRRKYPPITNYSRFDMARKGHSRRILAIPNPISQFFLSKAICEHQGEFEETFKGSEISLTPANISASSSRAVPLEAISKLCADVSCCIFRCV